MERISALMDGELGPEEVTRLIPGVKEREDLREAWTTYHLIGEALRGQTCANPGIVESVAVKLAQEPTVLAPRRSRARDFGRRFALPSLAAAAAVATVTWVGLQTQFETTLPVAAVPASHFTVPAVMVQQSVLPEFAQPAHLSAPPPPPIQIPARQIDAYLQAHQEFSPSMTIQGLAPYVRTVTSGAVETGR